MSLQVVHYWFPIELTLQKHRCSFSRKCWPVISWRVYYSTPLQGVNLGLFIYYLVFVYRTSVEHAQSCAVWYTIFLFPHIGYKIASFFFGVGVNWEHNVEMEGACVVCVCVCVCLRWILPHLGGGAGVNGYINWIMRQSSKQNCNQNYKVIFLPFAYLSQWDPVNRWNGVQDLFPSFSFNH